MKFIKKLTFLSVLLCTLISIVALNLNVKATTGSTISGYTQITSVSEIESGKSYLITAVANGTTYVMSSDATSAAKPASTVSSDITDFSSYEFVITSTTNGYSIQNSSSYYLGYGTSGTNVAHSSSYTETTNDWTIEVGTNGSFRIASVKTSTRGLVFRASTYLVFGAYATSNVKASGTEYFDIELYKETDATGGESGDNTGSGSGDNTGGEVTNSQIAIFEFGADDSEKGETDGSSASSYTETSGNYTLTLENSSKVFSGSYDAKGNACLKLGTSSVVGSFSFTVDDSVDYVIIKVAGYKSTPAKISVNGGDTQTISTLSTDGEYTEVTVDTSSSKTVTFTTVSGGVRCKITSIAYFTNQDLSDVVPLTAPANVNVNAEGVITFATTDAESSYVARYDAVVSYNGITYSVQDVQSGDTLYYNIKGEATVTVQAISNDTLTYSNSDATNFNWNITADYPVVTIEEFIAADVHDYFYYQITGEITSIADTEYGNLYLEDETGTVYVYGVLPEFGAALGQFSENEKTKDLAVGMSLTVYGPRALYNTTAQMQNAVYVSHTIDYAKVFAGLDTLTSLYLNYSYTETSGVTVEESDVTDFTKNGTYTGTISSLTSLDPTKEMGLDSSVYSAVYEKNDSTSSLYFNTEDIRLYSATTASQSSTNGTSLTINRNDGVKITKMVVVYAGSSYVGTETITDDASQTITPSKSNLTYTYEFANGTSSVKIQNTADASGKQVRIKSIELFYEITGTKRDYTFADGDAKLRFGAQISAEMYNALVAQGATFGVAIIPTTTLAEGTLTVDTEGAFVQKDMKAASVDANGAAVDDANAVYYQFALVIQNIDVANFGTEFTAVSYVYVNGNYYYMNGKTYSVKTIAQVYANSTDASYADHLDALEALANLE